MMRVGHSATMDYGCQQVLAKDKKLVALLEYLCQQANKVYNMLAKSISKPSDWEAPPSSAERW